MSRVESWYRRYFLVVFFVFGAASALYIIITLNGSGDVDWLYFASVATGLIAVRLAILIPDKMAWTLSRLTSNGTLHGTPEKIEQLRRRVDVRGARWALVGGIAGTAIMVITVLVVYTESHSPLDTVHAYLSFLAQSFTVLSGAFSLEDKLFVAVEGIPFVPAMLLIGFVVGYYLTYAVWHGRLGRFVRKQGISLTVQPGHPDGAAGLSNVGALFFFQAQLLAIPALFFGVWSLLLVIGRSVTQSYFNSLDAVGSGSVTSSPPAPPPEFVQYLYVVSLGWLTPYLIFFVVLLSGEVLAFVVPMLSFHTIMRQQKLALTREVDAIGQRIVATQKALMEADTNEEVAALNERLGAMKAYYHVLEHMPTWPVNVDTWWRFIIATSGLIVPLLAQPVVQKLLP